MAYFPLNRTPTKVGVRIGLDRAIPYFVTADEVHILRRSFAIVEAHGHVAALVFYRTLFGLNPALRSMFKTGIEQQAAKLIDMLGLAVSLSANPHLLEPELRDLGARHLGYGVREEHYDTVRRAMLDMLAEVLAGEFTDQVRQTWTSFYDYISSVMKAGAAQEACRSR